MFLSVNINNCKEEKEEILKPYNRELALSLVFRSLLLDKEDRLQTNINWIIANNLHHKRNIPVSFDVAEIYSLVVNTLQEKKEITAIIRSFLFTTPWEGLSTTAQATFLLCFYEIMQRKFNAVALARLYRKLAFKISNCSIVAAILSKIIHNELHCSHQWLYFGKFS